MNGRPGISTPADMVEMVKVHLEMESRDGIIISVEAGDAASKTVKRLRSWSIIPMRKDAGGRNRKCSVYQLISLQVFSLHKASMQRKSA